MDEPLFSVRMRASLMGKHFAGAERIVAASSLGEVTAELMSRVVNSADECADEAYCSVERINPDEVIFELLPDVSTFKVADWEAGRRLAQRLLVDAQVPEAVAANAIKTLADGAAPGGHVMRGAILMDVQSGRRLEADMARGIRVSRMDLATGARQEVHRQLASQGLDHYRVCEALVLAGKVVCAPGLVAELCWSDAPDYVTGYVSSPRHGYQRISDMKPAGDKLGGRVFFVDPAATELSMLIDFLEQQPVLFNALGQIYSPQVWTDDE